MKKAFFAGWLIISIAVTVALSGGCKSTLQPGGAYAPSLTNSDGTVTSRPDMVFYTTDSAFNLAYATINTVFELERTNRELLFRLSPDIKHTLDRIRPSAVDVATRWAIARQAYIANPTQAGLTGLQDILAKLQQIAVSVQAALPAGTL